MKFSSLPLALSFACAARADTSAGPYDDVISVSAADHPPASDVGLNAQAAGGDALPPKATNLEAVEFAGLPVDCVAFQPADGDVPGSSDSLQIGQCLTAGDAICSSAGGWAFGIDRADGMIKLWEGNRVSRFVCAGIFPDSGSSFMPTTGPAEARDVYKYALLKARNTDRHCHHIILWPIACRIINEYV